MNFKPRITLREQFKIPSPFRAWCHACEKGFEILDDLTRHNKDKINVHQGNTEKEKDKRIWGK